MACPAPRLVAAPFREEQEDRTDEGRACHRKAHLTRWSGREPKTDIRKERHADPGPGRNRRVNAPPNSQQKTKQRLNTDVEEPDTLSRM